MNILFLDDDASRHKKFRAWKMGETIYQAYTARECIDFLQGSFPLLRSEDNKIDFFLDELWLDHDLEDRTYVDENETNTGSEVVRYLLNPHPRPRPKIGRIYIHSLNETAGRSMGRKLKEAGYSVSLFPFTKVPAHPLAKQY